MRGIRLTVAVLIASLASLAVTATASAEPNITISGAPMFGIVTSGSNPTTFTADTDNAILNVTTLNNTLTTDDVVITSLPLGSQPGNVTINSPIGWSTAKSLSIQAVGNTNFNSAPLTATSATSALTIDSRLGIHADGLSPVVVPGPTTFKSTLGSADLSLPNNDFGQSLSVPSAAVSVDIKDIDDIQLAGINTGFLRIGAGGPITQSAPVTVANTTTFNTFSSVSLNHPGNSFADTVSIPFPLSVTLNTSGNLKLGATSVFGDLALTSGGTITTPGTPTVAVTGSTSLTAPTSITAGSFTNDFTGPVSATTNGLLTLRDTNDLVLGPVASNGTDIFAGTNLTQTGAITDTGVFDADGDSVTLTNPANDFNQALVQATAGALSLRDANSITLNGATATGAAQVIADLSLTVGAGSISNGSSLTLVADEGAGAGLGAGGITVGTNAVLTSSGAPVKLYSSRRSQNTIAANATLNGANFTPGPEFVDSATEVWNTRFPSGNATSPFTVFYKQDGAPPETTIDSGPAAGSTITNRTPTFTFSSSEGGSSFACSVDGGPFTACDSPHTLASLADGPHTFEVRATDAAANADPTPASRSFTVDVRPPETTITKAPHKKVKTRKKKAKVEFEFTSTEPGSSFACSLDGAAFTPCTSPAKYKLKKGAHQFAVRATDAIGNSDETPAGFDFTVKRKRKHH